MPQESQRITPQAQENTQSDEHVASQQEQGEAAQAQSDDLDSILDDIETVLETNAEEYVNSFVQKGGQ